MTAIFCSSDLMAVGVIRALNEKGLQVPDDVSVVGFDDIPAAKYINGWSDNRGPVSVYDRANRR